MAETQSCHLVRFEDLVGLVFDGDLRIPIWRCAFGSCRRLLGRLDSSALGSRTDLLVRLDNFALGSCRDLLDRWGSLLHGR